MNSRLIKHQFPFFLALLVLLVILFYQFSYLLPFTNNAFIVANINQVAANVNGYVTDVYVHNEQNVVKGQPLFQVFKKPYEYAYLKAQQDLAQARATFVVAQKQIEKTQALIAAQKQHYERMLFDYNHNQSASYGNAVSKIQVYSALKKKEAALNALHALEKELEINQQQLVVQSKHIGALSAVFHNAKVDLDETTVYALHDGSVQNMFIAAGTPIKIRTPVFTLVDTQTLFVQANFYETDLRHVRAGDKVVIMPRTYLGAKVYHGVVVSQNWAASRLDRNRGTGIEVLKSNADNWFLLPQRLPVQILITDYDALHYPLSIGQSAYVYIST